MTEEDSDVAPEMSATAPETAAAPVKSEAPVEETLASAPATSPTPAPAAKPVAEEVKLVTLSNLGLYEGVGEAGIQFTSDSPADILLILQEFSGGGVKEVMNEVGQCTKGTCKIPFSKLPVHNGVTTTISIGAVAEKDKTKPAGNSISFEFHLISGKAYPGPVPKPAPAVPPVQRPSPTGRPAAPAGQMQIPPIIQAQPAATAPAAQPAAQNGPRRVAVTGGMAYAVIGIVAIILACALWNVASGLVGKIGTGAPTVIMTNNPADNAAIMEAFTKQHAEQQQNEALRLENAQLRVDKTLNATPANDVPNGRGNQGVYFGGNLNVSNGIVVIAVNSSNVAGVSPMSFPFPQPQCVVTQYVDRVYMQPPVRVVPVPKQKQPSVVVPPLVPDHCPPNIDSGAVQGFWEGGTFHSVMPDGCAPYQYPSGYAEPCYN
jgi:hypothetical protein